MDTREGPIHWQIPRSNACLCGWTCDPNNQGSDVAWQQAFESHRYVTLLGFPANHKAMLIRYPGRRGRSPHFEMTCSCKHEFYLRDGTVEWFYTPERMIERFTMHCKEAAASEMVTLEAQKKVVAEVKVREQRREEAEQIAKSIKDRFLLDE